MFNIACLFKWLISSFKNNSSSFSSIIIGINLNFFPLYGFADQYFWQVFLWTYETPPYAYTSSPAAACDRVIAFYADTWAPGYIAEKTGFIKYSETQYVCSFYAKSTTGGLNGGPIDRPIYRVGDECPLNYSYTSESGVCTPDILNKQKGTPSESLSCPASTAGNLINFSIGNKFQREVDYQGSGSSSLRFARSYNSVDGIWRHSYSTRLQLEANKITLVMADGRESYFTLQGGMAKGESIELGQLAKVAGVWVYVAANNEKFTFDTQGRLTRWSQPSGVEQYLEYASANRLVTVTDSFNNSLKFYTNTQGQPTGLYAGGLSVIYKYNVNNKLEKLTRTINGRVEVVRFHYEDQRDYKLLTGITDARAVRYATWAYDDKGRAISSEHASGAERTLVSYNSDGSSTVTNELGKKTTYQFQIIQGIKRITAIEGEPSANCPNSNSTFTYDVRGLLKTKTDNKGFVTTYSYNTRGLEISRTEASGTAQSRTTTTTWHATLNLPLAVTEPGRVTTYTYDAQGRQLSQASAAL